MNARQASEREIQHRRLNVGRCTLHVAELGEGPALLLLHGFPAFWADWREQMAALAGAGFRAIAPDLPGYGGSDRLPGVLDYRAEWVADDLADLIRALGLPRAHVVGHDWGGVIAFCLAARHPNLVERLAVINAPHPERFRRVVWRFEQLRRSWYILFFQVPWLPEWLLQRRATIALCTRELAVRRDGFSETDVDRYWQAMCGPGVAHAALSYYRALLRAPARARPPILLPTLVLWGERDAALSAPLLLERLFEHVPNLTLRRFPNGGHWLHHDLPETVSEELTAFFQPQPSLPNANDGPQSDRSVHPRRAAGRS